MVNSKRKVKFYDESELERIVENKIKRMLITYVDRKIIEILNSKEFIYMIEGQIKRMTAEMVGEMIEEMKPKKEEEPEQEDIIIGRFYTKKY